MAAPPLPPVAPAIVETARAGAASEFRFLDRAAEVAPEGTCWQTLDGEGQPVYRGDLYSNGGIPLFLADYYRLTGDRRALDLGIAGARWCAAPGRRFLADQFGAPGEQENLGLVAGRAGVGLAWLRLAEATGDAAGVGHVFLRLLAPQQVRMALL